jgi:hypothetical protein
MNTEYWLGNLKEGGHLEDLRVDGKIILKWIFKNWDWGSVHLIDLLYAGCCNAGMNLRGPLECGGDSYLAEDLL